MEVGAESGRRRGLVRESAWREVGWDGVWNEAGEAEKGVGERECLAGSRVEWGMEGSGERVDVANKVMDW